MKATKTSPAIGGFRRSLHSMQGVCSSNPHPFDVVAGVERYKTGHVGDGAGKTRMPDLHRTLLAGDPEDGIDTQLATIKAGIIRHLRATLTDYEAMAEIQSFEGAVWPVLEPALRTNPAMRRVLRTENRSQFFPTFAADILAGNLASAVLASFGIGMTMQGQPAVIPPDDDAMLYCAGEAAFSLTRARARCFQEYAKDAGRIVSLGAGYCPELWTDGFQLQPNQQVLCIDRDDCRPMLRTLMGTENLEAHGIHYVVGDVLDLFMSPSADAVADLAYFAGIASYYSRDPAQFASMLAGASRLLETDGLMVFDLSVMNESYVFDVKALNWPSGLNLETSTQSAIDKVQAALQTIDGLQLVTVATDDEISPAGVIFVVRKVGLSH